ncbi:MAG: RDD family protein [Candidatus Hydrogenedentes bacterium]|nr:RDD family protein [Candidatus Hydrogenedentota bacterium]
MDWYYVENGAQQGPINDTEFRDLQAKSVITPNTLVWRAGMAEWLPLARIQGLDAAVTPETAEQHGMAACAECGALFPQEDMISFRNSWICATCKPVFFQRLKEGAALPGQLVYAGFWIRFGAAFIDGIILIAVGTLTNLAVSAVTQFFSSDAVYFGSMFLSILLNQSVDIAYQTWFIGRFGATPGKMALGLKVVRPDGEPMTYMRAFGRAGAKIVSGIILNIGYIMAGFDEEKRALHDRMCDTRVIRTRQS